MNSPELTLRRQNVDQNKDGGIYILYNFIIFFNKEYILNNNHVILYHFQMRLLLETLVRL